MPDQNAAAPRLYALLIAADCYLPNRLPEGTYPSLKGCVRDVTHIEDFLKKRLKMTDDQVVKLTSTNTGASEPPEPPERRPTYENMVRAFQDLTARAAAGDLVFIHYSGHGGRSRTSLPKVKGAKALDESLVPIDIGNSDARYLRDHELAKLLKVMVDKGLIVTIVLDSCHSGGATRGLRSLVQDVAVRGVDFIDSTPRPTASLVASQEELEAAWSGLGVKASAGVTRDLTLGDARQQDYILLAACRPNELANEAAFEGNERNGALTYWLLDTLQQLGPGLTYKMVHDRVLAKVASQFPEQVPMLQGDPGRLVFGSEHVQPEFTTLVDQVAPDGQSVVLQTGQALGVRAEAQFVIYPRTAASLSRPEDRLALVKVSELGSTTSRAQVLQKFGTQPVGQGDQAVLLGAAALKLVRKVRTVRRDGPPADEQAAALERFEQAVPGSGWVELAQPEDQVDFLVSVSQDGQTFEICDRSGLPITNLRPPVQVGEPGAAAKLVRRLVHLTKFRATQELENKDPRSPLKNKLKVTLMGTQKQFNPADDTPNPTPFDRPGELPTIEAGDWVFVKIENLSAVALNVAVLDLSPGWGVAQVYPRQSAFEELDARGEPLVLPLPSSLAEGDTEGTDTLKVLATVGSADFRTLTLPKLDQPIASRGARALGSLLDQLISALAEEQPQARDIQPAANPSEEWTTAQVAVHIVRPAASAV